MNDNNDTILFEVPPLYQRQAIFVERREKSTFDFPIHRHEEFEIVLVEGAAGAVRVVGDSVEPIGDCDLFIVGHGLRHAYLQGECKAERFTELVVQFHNDLFSDDLLRRDPMYTIAPLLKNCAAGITFGENVIRKVAPKLKRLPDIIDERNCFYQYLLFLEVLNDLSQADEYRLLSKKLPESNEMALDSRRIKLITDYLREHFSENIEIEMLAAMLSMSPKYFHRFFKAHTGFTPMQYLSQLRLACASRLLVYTLKPVSEVCFESGFNNLSHFCRFFKANQKLTPADFRIKFRKNRMG